MNATQFDPWVPTRVVGSVEDCPEGPRARDDRGIASVMEVEKIFPNGHLGYAIIAGRKS